MGDTDEEETKRAEIIAALNELALARVGTSFNELCEKAQRGQP